MEEKNITILDYVVENIKNYINRKNKKMFDWYIYFFGATRFVDEKIYVFIGGGGSTEIALYDKKIKESVNTKFGVIDVMQRFPDLADDIATTDLEQVKNYIKENLKLPKQKADILILAGGGHEKFARLSGIKYEKNTLYKDITQPIMMDIETRISETKRFYKEISLDKISNKKSKSFNINFLKLCCNL